MVTETIVIVHIIQSCKVMRFSGDIVHKSLWLKRWHFMTLQVCHSSLYCAWFIYIGSLMYIEACMHVLNLVFLWEETCLNLKSIGFQYCLCSFIITFMQNGNLCHSEVCLVIRVCVPNCMSWSPDMCTVPLNYGVSLHLCMVTWMDSLLDILAGDILFQQDLEYGQLATLLPSSIYKLI